MSFHPFHPKADSGRRAIEGRRSFLFIVSSMIGRCQVEIRARDGTEDARVGLRNVQRDESKEGTPFISQGAGRQRCETGLVVREPRVRGIKPAEG